MEKKKIASILVPFSLINHFFTFHHHFHLIVTESEIIYCYCYFFTMVSNLVC